MINIIDNFLDEELYKATYDKLVNNDFVDIELGDKHFWVQQSDKAFDDIVLEKLSIIDGVKRESLLAFFRVSTEELDTDWRIHADSKVGDIRPERALIFYISPSTKEGLHGTAFWKHKRLGYAAPEDISNEDFDKLLKEESNVLDNWDLHSVVGYKPNRALTFPSLNFHSKYPNTGWEEGRMVYVMFYK